MNRTVVQNKIRDMRVARDWTQQELAERVGVSRQSIISIEQGHYIPSLPLALTLARLFGCSVDTLFWLKENTR
jgi:putative transcriptional regulator